MEGYDRVRAGCARKRSSRRALHERMRATGSRREGGVMTGSVYKVIEIIGTSDTSWEEAAKTAVEEAASHLEDLRVAEIVQQDLKIDDNKVVAYRARVKVSFRYRKDA
jgi:flavin-binding protein dodecin